MSDADQKLSEMVYVQRWFVYSYIVDFRKTNFTTATSQLRYFHGEEYNSWLTVIVAKKWYIL